MLEVKILLTVSIIYAYGIVVKRKGESTERGMHIMHNEYALKTLDLCSYNVYIIKVLHKYKR